MKKFIILSIILIFALLICQGQNEKEAVTQDTFQLYFPIGSFRDRHSYSNEEAKYSMILYGMKEPIIYTNDSLNETYRFICLRNMGDPIVIRIEKRENDYVLYWKLFGSAGKKYIYEGDLIVDKQKIINESSWKKFKNLVSQVDFWNLKTNQNDGACFDGAQWILEGKNSSQYHVVDKFSPHRKSKYYQVCNFLIKLTDLQF